MPSTDADAPVIAPRSSFEQNSTLTPASAATSVNLAIFGAGILGAALLVPFDGLVRRRGAGAGLVALLLTFSGRRCAFPGRR